MMLSIIGSMYELRSDVCSWETASLWLEVKRTDRYSSTRYLVNKLPALEACFSVVWGDNRNVSTVGRSPRSDAIKMFSDEEWSMRIGTDMSWPVVCVTWYKGEVVSCKAANTVDSMV